VTGGAEQVLRVVDEPTYWLGVTQSLTTVDELAHALGPYRSVALSLRDELEQDRAWAIRLYGPQGGPPTRDRHEREALAGLLDAARTQFTQRQTAGW
jgi:hypothetical protein